MLARFRVLRAWLQGPWSLEPLVVGNIKQANLTRKSNLPAQSNWENQTFGECDVSLSKGSHGVLVTSLGATKKRLRFFSWSHVGVALFSRLWQLILLKKASYFRSKFCAKKKTVWGSDEVACILQFCDLHPNSRPLIFLTVSSSTFFVFRHIFCFFFCYFSYSGLICANMTQPIIEARTLDVKVIFTIQESDVA